MSVFELHNCLKEVKTYCKPERSSTCTDALSWLESTGCPSQREKQTGSLSTSKTLNPRNGSCTATSFSMYRRAPLKPSARKSVESETRGVRSLDASGAGDRPVGVAADEPVRAKRQESVKNVLQLLDTLWKG